VRDEACPAPRREQPDGTQAPAQHLTSPLYAAPPCSKTWMSCFSGCVAGVLGLTGLNGFFFYVFAQLVRLLRVRPPARASLPAV
jgi:hypothetical protein